MVPMSICRQLRGTLGAQLECLRGELRLHEDADALDRYALNGPARRVLLALRDAGRELRPREIEDTLRAARATVNTALHRLESLGLAARRGLPSPGRGKAFAWRAVGWASPRMAAAGQVTADVRADVLRRDASGAFVDPVHAVAARVGLSIGVVRRMRDADDRAREVAESRVWA